MPESPSHLLNLQGRTRSELLGLKLKLEAEITSIRFQIERARDEARRTGRYADGAWWVKSNHALRIKGRQCQQIQNELSRLRNHKVKTVEQRFVDLARAKLSPEVFAALLRDARDFPS